MRPAKPFRKSDNWLAVHMTVLLVWLGATVSVRGADKLQGPTEIKGKWLHLKTAHFDAFSNNSETSARGLLADLEQFTWALAKLYDLRLSTVPIVVVQFNSDAALKPFKPQAMRSRDTVRGLFLTFADENVILAGPSGTASEEQRVLRHEYVHFVTSGRWGFQPFWCREGMAEFYSTFQVRGGKARIGAIVAHHPRQLAERGIPLAHLLTMTGHNLDSLKKEDVATFYAESWALFHYLLFDRKSTLGTDALVTFLRLSSDKKVKPDQALAQAFQTDLATLEKQYRSFLKADTYTYLDMKLDTSVAKPSVTVRAATPDEVAFHLGNALFVQGREAEAENYYRLAGTLADSPARMHDGLGRLAWRRGQHTNACEHLQEAIRLGSQDFRTHYLLALAQRESGFGSDEHKNGSRETETTAVLGVLDKAIQLQPDFAPAHDSRARFSLSKSSEVSKGWESLRRALELEPGRLEFQLTLAEYHLLARRYPDALQIADQLADRDELPIQMRLEAESLRWKARRGLNASASGN